MVNKSLLMIVFFSLTAFLFAQTDDPVIISYRRNFVRASISTKIELVTDASRITTVNMTPLYLDAVSFVLANYQLLGNDSQLMDIAAVAADKTGFYSDPAAIPSLQKLFAMVTEPRVRIATLKSLAELTKQARNDVSFLNDWFDSAITRSLEKKGEDVRVMIACARSLGSIGAGSSFPVLFRAATSKLDSGIVSEAEKSLNAISDNYAGNILAIIREKPLYDVYAAFSFAMKREELPVVDKGAIAEAAFTRAVAHGQTEQRDTLYTSLVKESLDVLGSIGWSQASPAVVQFFYHVQSDYKTEKADVGMLTSVITCMGGMGTTEAAQALSIFLGLLNSETEQKKTYNEQVLLSVIQSLGALGDKSAFDYLLYVGYLDYPETVKQAARDALARLEW
ncbi:MAG TPA: hypothetical protein PLP41_03035 [Treponemataceae bacterium]|jgi:HEAT repeat protein|nr:HEAT repeat domain-containing protein [Treponema sp.]HOF84668.1 hypothetical protein [Treponemataceae bacterium]HOS34929.1 hypothetical protein [Treponemataceae bacterium]HOU38905.1 hypothetical protein [Treponemataceae bacterium]HPL91163.1 hypothetical protein [Treponemataceae bacterium]